MSSRDDDAIASSVDAPGSIWRAPSDRPKLMSAFALAVVCRTELVSHCGSIAALECAPEVLPTDLSEGAKFSAIAPLTIVASAQPTEDRWVFATREAAEGVGHGVGQVSFGSASSSQRIECALIRLTALTIA
jgi:hypothetical protein